MLHTMTRRAPATPATTMVSTVMLSGGALRPWARRRRLRVMETSAYSPTATTRTIQLAATLMLPLTRL